MKLRLPTLTDHIELLRGQLVGLRAVGWCTQDPQRAIGKVKRRSVVGNVSQHQRSKRSRIAGGIDREHGRDLVEIVTEALADDEPGSRDTFVGRRRQHASGRQNIDPFDVVRARTDVTEQITIPGVDLNRAQRVLHREKPAGPDIDDITLANAFVLKIETLALNIGSVGAPEVRLDPLDVDLVKCRGGHDDFAPAVDRDADTSDINVVTGAVVIGKTVRTDVTGRRRGQRTRRQLQHRRGRLYPGGEQHRSHQKPGGRHNPPSQSLPALPTYPRRAPAIATVCTHDAHVLYLFPLGFSSKTRRLASPTARTCIDLLLINIIRHLAALV